MFQNSTLLRVFGCIHYLFIPLVKFFIKIIQNIKQIESLGNLSWSNTSK